MDSWSFVYGDRVGRYRILTRIADGGMATVYLAELNGPDSFEKQVALKVIHRNLTTEPNFVAMFVDEARIAARLDHPNIVQTFDLVQDEDLLAIAMEYAPGLPASALLPSSGAEGLELEVSPELVAYVGAETAAGLHHAHTLTDHQAEPLGIVHRDVAPANIQIGFDGRVRVVDFGIARARDRLSSTAPGHVLGTFAYIAPERFEGAEPSPRTDVWSLGVVLWELLVGRRLFRRHSDPETALAVMSDAVPPVAMLRADVPPALAIAIERALERDPTRRWASAGDLEETLRDVLPARPMTVLDPLLRALAPHREMHLARLRALLDPPQPAVIPIFVEEPEGEMQPAPLDEEVTVEAPVTPTRDPAVVPTPRRGAVAPVAMAFAAALVGAIVTVVALVGFDPPPSPTEAPRPPPPPVQASVPPEPARDTLAAVTVPGAQPVRAAVEAAPADTDPAAAESPQPAPRRSRARRHRQRSPIFGEDVYRR